MKRSKYVQLSLAASVALAISGEVAAQDQQRFNRSRSASAPKWPPMSAPTPTSRH
jgi:hypothetical protein